MLFQKSTAICLLAIAIVGSTRLARAKEPSNPLEGVWTVSEIVFHGHRMEKRIAGMRFIFANDTMTIDSTGIDNPLYDRQKVSFSASTEGAINSIETTNLDGRLEGVKREGIWRIDGDTLSLCIPTKDHADQPDEFVSTEDSKTAMYVMRRSSER